MSDAQWSSLLGPLPHTPTLKAPKPLDMTFQPPPFFSLFPLTLFVVGQKFTPWSALVEEQLLIVCSLMPSNSRLGTR